MVFGPDGKLLLNHRKLVPTYTEKLVWGQGDANGLKTIEADTVRIASAKTVMRRGSNSPSLPAFEAKTVASLRVHARIQPRKERASSLR